MIVGYFRKLTSQISFNISDPMSHIVTLVKSPLKISKIHKKSLFI
jgi:hypothetical protein